MISLSSYEPNEPDPEKPETTGPQPIETVLVIDKGDLASIMDTGDSDLVVRLFEEIRRQEYGMGMSPGTVGDVVYNKPELGLQ